MGIFSRFRPTTEGRGLRLRRPLAVLDLETTGISPAADRIVEICVMRLSADGAEKLLRQRVNPEVPIPPGATAVHGITDADVAGEPTFSQIAVEVRDFLTECDLAGFNIARFDLPLLEAEFNRAAIGFSREGRAIVDVMVLYHMKERRDLSAAAQFYIGRTLPDLHSPEADARATFDILRAQLERYEDLPLDVESLHDLCNPVNPDWIDPEGKFAWAGGVAIITFGRHKGRTLQDLAADPEPNYLHWMLGADFSAEAKEIARNALNGTLPAPPAAVD